MKKYLFGQLTQVSAWIGFVLIFASMLVPRWALVLMGVLLVITDDSALKGWVQRNAPGFTKWLEDVFNAEL